MTTHLSIYKCVACKKNILAGEDSKIYEFYPLTLVDYVIAETIHTKCITNKSRRKKWSVGSILRLSIIYQSIMLRDNEGYEDTIVRERWPVNMDLPKPVFCKAKKPEEHSGKVCINCCIWIIRNPKKANDILSKYEVTK